MHLGVLFQRLAPTGPPRTVTVTGGGVLDLPEVEVFRVRTTCHAPLGVVTVAGSWAEDGRWRLLLVTPRLHP